MKSKAAAETDRTAADCPRYDQRMVRDAVFRYCDGEGPECPHCGETYTADEPHYHDTHGFKMNCDGCGKEFQVWPNIEVTWRTESIPNKD